MLPRLTMPLTPHQIIDRLTARFGAAISAALPDDIRHAIETIARAADLRTNLAQLGLPAGIGAIRGIAPPVHVLW